MSQKHRTAFVLLVTAAFVLACAAPAFAGGKFPSGAIAIDGTDLYEARATPMPAAAESLLPTPAIDPQILVDHGQPDLWLVLTDNDPAHAGQYLAPFWKEAWGDHSDIYVGWNDLKAPEGSSQQSQLITQYDIEYMRDEFDGRIWASDVFHFGNYKPRVPKDLSPEEQATFDGTRAGIFIYNIRDEAYWTDFRYYIAGYFSSGLNDDMGINAIFIDSYDWGNRTRAGSARPYLYEGVIAHEFQHLIHHDVDGDEDSFLDEGMADLAEQFIYGTITTNSHIGEYLYFHRDSLITWAGELADYGNAVLFQDYLWERAGGVVLGDATRDPLDERVADNADPYANDRTKFVDLGDQFIWDLVHKDSNGLESIAEMVGGMGAVEAVHRDFTLANLLDGRVDNPIYNYRNLQLGGVDSDYYTVEDGLAYYQATSLNAAVHGNMPPRRYRVARRTGTEPWGAYYRTYTGAEPGFTMAFSGNATDGVLPFSAPTEWFSGLGNMLSRTLEQTFTVAAGDELSFMTWFDIEDQWDYGYVQARKPGGDWTQLLQLSALPAAVSDVNKSTAWLGAGGFTGNSNEWQEARFDLTGYAGEAGIRFLYSTDEAANGFGWYIDDIAVGSTMDHVDSIGGWTSKGWMFTSGMQHDDWSVDVYVPYAKAQMTGYDVKTVVPTTGTQTAGSTWVNTQYLKAGNVYAIVSNRPRDGVFDSSGRVTILKGK